VAAQTHHDSKWNRLDFGVARLTLTGVKIDLANCRHANCPPDSARGGDGGRQNEGAVIAGALNDDPGHDRSDDPGQIADRILHADPCPCRARTGEHLGDGVKVERQRGRGGARQAEQDDEQGVDQRARGDPVVGEDAQGCCLVLGSVSKCGAFRRPS